MRGTRGKRIRRLLGQSLAAGIMYGAEITRRFLLHIHTPQPSTTSRVIIWPKEAPGNATLYIASREGTKYHTPQCRWAAQIADEHRVQFKTPEEAQTAGYEACGTCNPNIKIENRDRDRNRNRDRDRE